MSYTALYERAELVKKLEREYLERFFAGRDSKLVYNLINTYVIPDEGKAFREVLAHAALEDLDSRPEKCQHIYAALGLMHRSLLLIDNMQDQQETRHGKPTLHTIIGEAQTYNVAMTLHDESIIVLEKPFQDWLSSMKKLRGGVKQYIVSKYERPFRERRDKLQAEIINCYLQTSEGQTLEINTRDMIKKEGLDGWKKLDMTIVEKIYELKTGYYTGGLPLALAFIESNERNPSKIEKARITGTKAGIAFQAMDDRKDLIEDIESYNNTGKHLSILKKELGEDLQEGKITRPVLDFVLNCRSNDELYKFLHKFGLGKGTLSYDEKTEKIKLLDKAGSLDRTEKWAANLKEEAKKEVDTLFNNRGQAVKDIFDYAVDRKV